MKLISPYAHGVVDYLTVVLFLAAPFLFALSPVATAICYILAGVHLLMTILTGFDLGGVWLIPFALHGIVEFVVAALLIAGPWLIGEPFSGNDIGFFMVMGALIFVVWLLSDYGLRREGE